MSAASLESKLLLMVDMYQEDVSRISPLPNSKGKIKALLEWNLGELLDVTAKLNWLPGFSMHTGILKKLRNLAHPGNYVRTRQPRPVSLNDVKLSLTILGAATEKLTETIGKR